MPTASGFDHRSGNAFHILLDLVLPEPQHDPIQTPKLGVDLRISCAVLAYLLLPEFGIRHWRGVVGRATMPEAPINEDRQSD